MWAEKRQPEWWRVLPGIGSCPLWATTEVLAADGHLVIVAALQRRLPAGWAGSILAASKAVAVDLYRVEGVLEGPAGNLPVVCIWMKQAIDGRFRFVTLKPAKGRSGNVSSTV